jgi:hypothetical protein
VRGRLVLFVLAACLTAGSLAPVASALPSVRLAFHSVSVYSRGEPVIVMTGDGWDPAFSFCGAQSLDVSLLTVQFGLHRRFHLGTVQPADIAPFTGHFAASYPLPSIVGLSAGRAYVSVTQDPEHRYSPPLGCNDVRRAPLLTRIGLTTSRTSTPDLPTETPGLRMLEARPPPPPSDTPPDPSDPRLPPDAALGAPDPVCPPTGCDADWRVDPGSTVVLAGFGYDLPDSCSQGILITLTDHSGVGHRVGLAAVDPLTGRFLVDVVIPARGVAPGRAIFLAQTTDSAPLCGRSARYPVEVNGRRLIAYPQALLPAGAEIAVTGFLWATVACAGPVSVSLQTASEKIHLGDSKAGAYGFFYGQFRLPQAFDPATVKIVAVQRSAPVVAGKLGRTRGIRCVTKRTKSYASREIALAVSLPPEPSPLPPLPPQPPPPQPTMTALLSGSTLVVGGAGWDGCKSVTITAGKSTASAVVSNGTFETKIDSYGGGKGDPVTAVCDGDPSLEAHTTVA